MAQVNFTSLERGSGDGGSSPATRQVSPCWKLFRENKTGPRISNVSAASFQRDSIESEFYHARTVGSKGGVGSELRNRNEKFASCYFGFRNCLVPFEGPV